MSRKRLVLALLVIAGVATGLAFKFNSSQGRKQKGRPQQVADEDVYYQLFRHQVAMKKKAGELEKLGNDGKFLRGFYQREAKLNDHQAKQFDEIASSCDEAVAAQDTKAKAIIDAALHNNGNGKLPKGTSPPVAPPELQDLWNERNEIILRARDRLRVVFGPQEFQRFDQFVRNNVAGRMTSDPVIRQRPESRMGPRHQPHLDVRPSPQGR